LLKIYEIKIETCVAKFIVIWKGWFLIMFYKISVYDVVMWNAISVESFDFIMPCMFVWSINIWLIVV